MSTNANGRPMAGAAGQLVTETEPEVTRAAVEALVASVGPDERLPGWALMPRNETEFIAALQLRVEAVDDNGCGTTVVRWDGDQAYVELRVAA